MTSQQQRLNRVEKEALENIAVSGLVRLVSINVDGEFPDRYFLHGKEITKDKFDSLVSAYAKPETIEVDWNHTRPIKFIGYSSAHQ